MLKTAICSAHARILLATSLLLLAVPTARVCAQEEGEEGGGDIDSMMQADPDRPAKAEEEGEGEAGGDEQAGDGEQKASGDQGSDDERAFREMPDESKHKKKSEEEEAPPDPGAKGLGIGALLGYGISLESGANIWSAGFGLQGNYDTGVFVIGARFVYYIGGSVELPVRDNFQVITGTEKVSANIWELSVDLGFDIDASPKLTLRPGLGIGFASASGKTSKVYGAFSPGAALLYDVSDSFYLGLDARLQVVTAQPAAQKGIILLAAAGLHI